MKTPLVSLTLIVAGLVCAAAPIHVQAQSSPTTTVASAPDPARQIRDTAHLFRIGDVAGLVRAVVPPAQLEQVRTAYDLKRTRPITDADRAEFEQTMAKVIAPDAVERLMAQIEPKLVQARPQAAGALLMGFGAMQMAVASPESDLTEEQRDTLRAALPGIQKWAASTDFLSSDTLRDALTLLTDAARRAQIHSLDQLKSLPLDEVLRRSGAVLAAAKDAVQLYGLDVDAVVDSLQVDVLANDGRTARVRTTITVFDAPIWSEHDLVLVDGRWYGEQQLQRWSIDADDAEDEDEDEDEVEG